ncbi:MAG: MDR family MFS transporter [Caulobacterales bacterium]
MNDVALARGALDLEARREAEAEAAAAIAGEPSAEPLAAEPEVKPFSSLVPAIIGCAMMMQTLNATVISNALPTMARALHEDPVHLNTAITVYLLASAIFLPISGWAADKFGAKRIFLLAIAGYALACAACGFAQNVAELLLARFAQGAAGAMLGPVGRLVLLRSTPKHDLVRAMSVLTMPSLLGPVIGPPLGGFIVTYGSWRWIFFLNLPIALLGLFLVIRFIKDVREEDAPRLDWVGLFLTGIGMAGVVYGFENLGRNAFPPVAVAAMMGGGALCLTLYTWHASRISHAILDLKLLKIHTFTASVVGGAFMRMGIGATPFLLALLLQVAFNLSALQAGLMTFASAAAALVMKTCAPPILAHFGFRNTLTANAVIVAITFMGYALFTRTTPHWLIYAVLLGGGFFRSLQFTALNGLAFADINQPQMSRASTMSTMGQQLSQSIGIGLSATLLTLFRGHVQSPVHAHLTGRLAAMGHLTAGTIAPVFVCIGLLSLVSALFFVRLPADAGAGLHGQPRPVRA